MKTHLHDIEVLNQDYTDNWIPQIPWHSGLQAILAHCASHYHVRGKEPEKLVPEYSRPVTCGLGMLPRGGESGDMYSRIVHTHSSTQNETMDRWICGPVVIPWGYLYLGMCVAGVHGQYIHSPTH